MKKRKTSDGTMRIRIEKKGTKNRNNGRNNSEMIKIN